MEIYAYLRASTEKQDAERAKSALDDFVKKNNKSVTEYFYEKKSGTTLNRPELSRLLDTAKKGDAIVVEQVDRLTRLTANDWRKLKNILEDKGIFVISLDVPTSHMFIDENNPCNEMFKLINSVMIDMLATTARKDYEDMKRRQAEGIARAKSEGKYKGKQRSSKTIESCEKAISFITEKGLTKEQASTLSKVGVATFYRYLKDNNITIINNVVYRDKNKETEN